MKLTGKRVYKNNKEIGLVIFTYSELSKKQKELYEKSNIYGHAALLASNGEFNWNIKFNWNIETHPFAKYLKEIILDNFPEFNFNGKGFWFYLEEEISSNYLVKQPPSILKNE